MCNVFANLYHPMHRLMTGYHGIAGMGQVSLVERNLMGTDGAQNRLHLNLIVPNLSVLEGIDLGAVLSEDEIGDTAAVVVGEDGLVFRILGPVGPCHETVTGQVIEIVDYAPAQVRPFSGW
jgi:hypothetical protein